MALSAADARAGSSEAGAPGPGSEAWWAARTVRPLLPPIERGNAAVKEALRQMHWEGGAAAAAPLAALRRRPALLEWGVALAAAAGLALRHVAAAR